MSSPPRLPGDTIVRESADDLLDALAADLVVHAINCVGTFGSFHVALSGGSTPMPLYRRLMVDPNCRHLPWRQTHLWIVDERRVPFEDERSNFGQIRELIVDHSDIPELNVHPMPAMDEDADTRYERELVEVLGARGEGKDRLDFVLLGMGGDAHTASLFPGSPALKEQRRLVRINAGPKVTPPERVTMTYPLINASRFIAVLVTGASKRETLKKVAELGARTDLADAGARAAAAETLPILGVRPLAGEMRWYLDGEAGAF
ncbi:MAG: 6-phosphogluconolactonase [Phycisphaerales bacterium]|nr:6-phosphogluconolactonase [Phycisphaerales bacterium]